MDDLISRQAVLEGLASIAKTKAKSDAQKSMMGRMMFFVEQLPSVSVAEKTGHWIDQGYKEEWWEEYYKCSNCGAGIVGRDNYCPNCGARMGVEE